MFRAPDAFPYPLLSTDFAEDIAYARGGVTDTRSTTWTGHEKRYLGEVGLETETEKTAMRKIYLRLLPFAVLSYILAYIDRINVSFAGLTIVVILSCPRPTLDVRSERSSSAISSSRCRATSSWKRSARGYGSRAS